MNTPDWMAQAPLAGLVFARCGGLLAVAPPLNIRQFPVWLRVGIAGVLAAALTPGAAVDTASARLALPMYTALLVREAAVGALLGLAAALVFHAFTVGGQLVDAWLGSGDTSARAQGQGPMTTLLYLTAGAAFLALDCHHWLLSALQGSFTELPVGAGALTADALTATVALAREMLVVGVAVAAPALAVIFVAEVTLAGFARCLPGMNLGEVTQPVRWSTGVIGMAASAPVLTHVLVNEGERVVEAVRALTTMLAGGG